MKNTQVDNVTIKKDLVVIGGGMPGICAAVQAARLGLDVALINDRGYLGGNASAEIRVPIDGASSCSEFNFYSRESGIILEILLENLKINPQQNPYLWDAVLKDFLNKEDNLEVFLDTYVDEVETLDNATIASVSGTQRGSEYRFKFKADFFLDDTGDGTVGYLAGAEYRLGREARNEFGEKIAPEEADEYGISSTLSFKAIDTGKPVSYTPPSFALDITKSDLLLYREIPCENFYESQWYYQVSGKTDQIKNSQGIIKDHMRLVYGIWDYIKNSGKYDADNYDLAFVSSIPGKRETRRLVGDYILNENDLINQSKFDDVVGHGGRAIDIHAIEGFFSKELENHYWLLKGIYQIPYRCGYSRNIENLFFAGRNMSTTHVAFGSTRVMATLCTLGQAVGAAAFLCKELKETPRRIYEKHITKLQQLLLKEDQYVVDKVNEDKDDKMMVATIKATSVKICQVVDQKYEHTMENKLGLVLPVQEALNDLFIQLKNNEVGTLKYKVYMPDQKVNYSPDDEIAGGEIQLDVSHNFRWVKLPVRQRIKTNKVFIIMYPDHNLKIGLSDKKLIGVVSLIEKENKMPRIFDSTELKMKDLLWRKLGKNICFKTDPVQNVYDCSNINNGFSRPYGLPNVWISEDNQQEEELNISFAEPTKISELRLYFDPDYNIDYHPYSHTVPGLIAGKLAEGEKHVEHGLYSDLIHLGSSEIMGQNVVPTLIKDYNVYLRVNGEWTEIAKIRNNYQKVNIIKYDTLKADQIKIKLLKTNGVSNYHIFEIRAY